jgi:ABC-2 type transport system ATP-binding protein
VIAGAKLFTWRGEGPGVDRLSHELLKDKAVEMAAPFGLALHVSGSDEKGLERALAPYRKSPFKWTRTEPTLEDVFIHLMSGVEDNFR